MNKLDDKLEDLKLNAYYYGFEATGFLPIDKILEAVAMAGSIS